jgi:hypothetical protein
MGLEYRFHAEGEVWVMLSRGAYFSSQAGARRSGVETLAP